MKLYSYFRSSAAYRVRIALNLKGIKPDETIYINLKNGEHLGEAYGKVNPAHAVPALVVADGAGGTLTQSLAIIEYLEETHPTPPLLPENAVERARVRMLSQLVACDIHPVNNLRVLKYITKELTATEEQKTTWIRHWIGQGFAAIEHELAASPLTGDYCHGDSPTIADCCLIPQIYNAERFGTDLTPYPNIQRINNNCLRRPEFYNASPAKQADCIT